MIKLKQLLIESIEDQLELKNTNSIDDMYDNLYTICSNSGNRKIVLLWAIEYVKNYSDIFKTFKDKYNIQNMDSFEKFINTLQKKARTSVNRKRKDYVIDYEKELAAMNVDNIERLAYNTSNEWERKLK